MDDFPEREPPAFWITVSIFVATLTLAVIMLVYTSVRAEAQEMLCPPTEPLLKQILEVHKEKPVWGGIISQGDQALEAILFQSEKNGWTFIIIRPDGRSCIVAAGNDAAPPLEPTDKGL